MDDVVFTDGETYIDLVPISCASAGLRTSLPQTMGFSASGLAAGLPDFGHESETLGENLHAACLVDEVERTAIEGEFLVRRLSVARQEHHRQVHAALAQLR